MIMSHNQTLDLDLDVVVNGLFKHTQARKTKALCFLWSNIYLYLYHQNFYINMKKKKKSGSQKTKENTHTTNTPNNRGVEELISLLLILQQSRLLR
jgi:hypothetical protein